MRGQADVAQIDDMRTIFLSSDEFKIAAQVKFDPSKLGNIVTEGM